MSQYKVHVSPPRSRITDPPWRREAWLVRIDEVGQMRHVDWYVHERASLAEHERMARLAFDKLRNPRAPMFEGTMIDGNPMRSTRLS